MLVSNFDLTRFFSKLWSTKRWWVPLALVVIVAINAAGLLLPKKWQSTAMVKIHGAKMKEMTGKMEGLLSTEERLVTLRDEIYSSLFLEEVAKQTNLDSGITPQSEEHTGLINRMRNSTHLRVKGRDLFTVTFTGLSPDEARNVADQIVKHWISRNEKLYANISKAIIVFLESELVQDQLTSNLASDAVLAYKEANINSIPEAQDEILRRLNRLLTQRQSLEQELSGLKETLAMANQQIKATQSDIISETTFEENAEVATLKSAKRGFQLQLDILLEKFTEEHWRVKEVQASLKRVDEQLKDAETEQVQTVTKALNPAHLHLQEEITKTSLKMASLQKNISTLNGDISELETYRDNVPKARDALEQLESDKLFAKEQVNILKIRLREARLTSEMEAKGQGPTFLLMQPPLKPTSPSSPNRKLIFVFSVFVGSVIALAMVYLLTVLDQAVRTAEEARRLLQMPVLGVVQRIVTAVDVALERRRRRYRIMGWGAGLLVIVGGIATSFILFDGQITQGVEILRDLIGQW